MSQPDAETGSSSSDSMRGSTSKPHPHDSVATETITEEEGGGEGEGELVKGGRAHNEQSDTNSGSDPADLSSASIGSILKEHKEKVDIMFLYTNHCI